MVKAYLRYEHRICFGVVASTSSSARAIEACSGAAVGSASASPSSSEKLLVTPALEAINVWHLRKGALVKRLVSSSDSAAAAGDDATPPEAQVTSLCRIENSDRIAAGYSNGQVKVWCVSRGTCEATFNGHRTAVSALRYSGHKAGSILASGGRDSDVVLWDLVADTGLFRLKVRKPGTRNPISSYPPTTCSSQFRRQHRV